MAPIQYFFKIVVDFTSPLNEAAILSRFENDVIPDLDAKINQRLNPHIDGLVIQRKTKLYALDVGFQFYPKAIITGDTNKPDDFIETRIDRALDDMKDIIDADIDAQGGNVLGWHRHLTSGALDE